MFQPAGVRTLLQMRSSMPIRPSTTTVLRTVQEEVVDATASPRPATAPAASGLERRSPIIFRDRPTTSALCAAIEEDEEDDLSDYGADPEPLLTNASTMLYQLQNTWREERRTELGQLCRELEMAYGLKPSAGLLDEILTPRPQCSDVSESSAAASLPGADPSDTSGAEGTEPEPEAEGSGDPNAEETDNSAEAVCRAAAHQLVCIQELRRQLERRRASAADAAESRAPLADDAAVGEVAVAGLSGDGAEDAQRLAALRREVEELRVKATEPAQESQIHIAKCEDQIRAQHGAVLEITPISELSALDKWIQDMKKFCRDTAGTSQCPSLPSRCAQSSTTGALSKKTMAQIAESRAVDWATQQKDYGNPCVSPSSGSPAARLRFAKPQGTGTSPKRASSLLSPTASSSGRATVATPLNGGRAPTSSSSGPKEDKSAVEQQLDEILSEFDEIDRIHSSICKLRLS